MKSLYESILSSTNTGVKGTIFDWWHKNFATKDEMVGRADVRQVNGKWYIVFDDFSSMSYQFDIEFTKNEQLLTMPKTLAGFLRCWYTNKDAKPEYYTVMYDFRQIQGITIDISQFDMTPGKYSLTENCIDFFYCQKIKLKGLPKYAGKYHVSEQGSKFSEISLQDENCCFYRIITFNTYFSELSETMNKCTLHSYYFCYKEFFHILKQKYHHDVDPEKPHMTFYELMYQSDRHGNYVLSKELQEYLDDFEKKNKIDHLIYMYDSENGTDSNTMKRITQSRVTYIFHDNKIGWYIPRN